MGVTLLGLTELLSLGSALTLTGLAIAWSVVLLASLAVSLRCGAWRWAPPRPWPGLRPRRPDPFGAVVLVPLAALLLALGAIGVISPPNTFDSMTYHMARLIHWQQSGSVAPYATNIPRQLYLQPGAEFALLHLQILSGGDHLANLVQWASFVGALIGASVIAAQLGAGRRGQLCAALAAGSVPMAILQSTSTQNDEVVGFWLICAMVFSLKLVQAPPPRLAWGTVLAFGASLGLALVTKAPAYLFALPMGLWVASRLLPTFRAHGLLALLLAGVVALGLNAGYYVRNLMVYDFPLGATDEGIPSLRYMNDELTPALFASNVVRDVGLNFVATPWETVNAGAQAVVLGIHGWLGVDIADPRTTWSGERFRAMPSEYAFAEGSASNPVQLLLIAFALAAVWPMRRVLGRSVGVYALVLLSGGVLFAAVLRWQPWHTRLELPLFLLGAPLVGVVLDRLSRRLAMAVTLLLLASMLPWVTNNDSRPLTGPRSILSVSRADQYFNNWSDLRGNYQGAIQRLAARGCTQVGFSSFPNAWEYPLWALLPGITEVDQVQVPNITGKLVTAADQQRQPCAILVLGSVPGTQTITQGGLTYQTSWSAGSDLARVAVLTPNGAP